MSWFHRALSGAINIFKPRASNPVRLESLRKSGTMSTLTSTAIFLAMSAVERFFSKAEFQCPCNLDAMVHQTIKSKVEHVDYGHFIWTYRFIYGFACIIVPAMALFFLAIVLNPTTWMLTTGFCHNARVACHWRSQLLLCRVFAKAFVVALAWIFFALLNGNYVKCAMTVESCNTGESSKGVTALNPDVWVAMSRLLALLVGLFAIVISCLGNVLIRCCFKTNSYQEECVKARYKERKLQRLEEIETATYNHLVELQLEKEGYLHRLPSTGGEEETPEIIVTTTVTTPTAIENASSSLEKDIKRLQDDIKKITSKVEDYNFCQSKLEREIGYLTARKKCRNNNNENDDEENLKDDAEKSARRSATLPLLGSGLKVTAGGNQEAAEMDHSDNDDPDCEPFSKLKAEENDYYTRQNTSLTNDTLLTET